MGMSDMSDETLSDTTIVLESVALARLQTFTRLCCRCGWIINWLSCLINVLFVSFFCLIWLFRGPITLLSETICCRFCQCKCCRNEYERPWRSILHRIGNNGHSSIPKLKRTNTDDTVLRKREQWRSRTMTM